MLLIFNDSGASIHSVENPLVLLWWLSITFLTHFVSSCIRIFCVVVYLVFDVVAWWTMFRLRCRWSSVPSPYYRSTALFRVMMTGSARCHRHNGTRQICRRLPTSCRRWRAFSPSWAKPRRRRSLCAVPECRATITWRRLATLSVSTESVSNFPPSRYPTVHRPALSTAVVTNPRTVRCCKIMSGVATACRRSMSCQLVVRYRAPTPAECHRCRMESCRWQPEPYQYNRQPLSLHHCLWSLNTVSRRCILPWPRCTARVNEYPSPARGIQKVYKLTQLVIRYVRLITGPPNGPVLFCSLVSVVCRRL